MARSSAMLRGPVRRVVARRGVGRAGRGAGALAAVGGGARAAVGGRGAGLRAGAPPVAWLPRALACTRGNTKTTPVIY